MFRNQYLLTNSSAVSFPQGFEEYQFFDIRIAVKAPLNVSLYVKEDIGVAIIGIAFDPSAPDVDLSDLPRMLGERAVNTAEFLKQADRLSGRFVMLWRKDGKTLVTGDACHLRQILFGKVQEEQFITSSVKLFLEVFALSPQTSREKEHFVGSDIYKEQRDIWYGDETIDDRVNRLLPNHILDFETGDVTRIPPDPGQTFLSEQDVINTVVTTLRGTYEYLVPRYTLIQPVTAGWDSRVLLAASKKWIDRINYYLFVQSAKEQQDVVVSEKLSEKLNFKLSVVEPQPLRSDFIQVYLAEHVNGRVAKNTAEIQSHFDRKYSDRVLNINGNVAEISRCFYGYTVFPVMRDMILEFSGYGHKSSFVLSKIIEWEKGARGYAKEIGIPLLDLFYWEQRMGNWGSAHPFAQDIAIEEISPFNNRVLILALSKISPYQRCAPKYRFIRQIAFNLWPEAMDVPVNPDSSYLKQFIKGRALLRYLLLKLKLKK